MHRSKRKFPYEDPEKEREFQEFKKQYENSKTMEEKLKRHIFSYGLITILFLLDELEQDEQFEKCQQIVNAINSLNEKYGWDLETRLTRKVIDDFFDAHKNSKNKGQVAFRNIPYYMEEVLKDISN